MKEIFALEDTLNHKQQNGNQVMNRSRNSLKSTENPQIALEEVRGGSRSGAQSDDAFVQSISQLKNGGHYYMWILGGALRHTKQSLLQDDSAGQFTSGKIGGDGQQIQPFDGSSAIASTIKYTKQPISQGSVWGASGATSSGLMQSS